MACTLGFSKDRDAIKLENNRYIFKIYHISEGIVRMSEVKDQLCSKGKGIRPCCVSESLSIKFFWNTVTPIHFHAIET